MVSIQLIAHDFHLQFVDNQSWCSVFLVLNNRTVELGADSKEVVVRKFLSILNRPWFPKLKWVREERQYDCFILLYEKHTSGYVRPTSSGIELHFKNGLNEPITTVNLTLEECTLWKKQLNKWLSSSHE